MDSITLEDALELLRYPVNLVYCQSIKMISIYGCVFRLVLDLNIWYLSQGNHPKDGQPIMLRLARAGFSVRHRRTIASVPKVKFKENNNKENYPLIAHFSNFFKNTQIFFFCQHST